MKQTAPDAFLSRQVLVFVRDHGPTVAEFTERFGGPGDQVLHILRKHGIIVVDGDRVRLNQQHLTPDRQLFMWGNKIIHLDDDAVDIVVRGPSRHPGQGEQA
jgi:hypothetical protein